MDGVVEIITGRERRRRWSTEEKLRVLAETTEPGAAIRLVAARNRICESLLYTWRRQVRDGTLHEIKTPAFVPVRVYEASMNAVSSASEPERTSSSTRSQARSDLIEIELGDGRQVRVGRDVNLAALRRVLTARRLSCHALDSTDARTPRLHCIHGAAAAWVGCVCSAILGLIDIQ